MTAMTDTRLGFFGKLPALGDFARRGLPPAFVQPWDDGMQQAMAAARQRHGARWQDAWRAAPTWRFLLAPRVCGEHAWAGIVGPSSDRVGRGFPMVMATPWTTEPSWVRHLLRATRWFGALAALHRRAQLTHGLDADALAAAIVQLPGPEAVDAAAGLAGLPAHAGHWRLPLADACAYEATLLDSWQQLARRPEPWCLWWTDEHTAAPAVLATRGLPTDYSLLLDEAVTRGAAPGPAPAVTADTPRHEATASMRPVAALAAATGTARALATATPTAPSPSPAHVAPTPVIHLRDRNMAVVCADDADTPDKTRIAQAVHSLASQHDGIDTLRDALLSLHTHLGQRVDPVGTPVADTAVVAAQWNGGHARLLRIGAAAAWHWRRGRLRPVFATVVVPDDGGLDDLLFGPVGPARPGLGGLLPPRIDDAPCALAPGDRLLLIATRALCGLPEARFADALAHADPDQVRGRLGQVAGLRSHPSTWPIGVIDIPA
jgi:type VI secretion system ImpM family protein